MSSHYAPLLEALTRLRGIRGALVVSDDDGLVVAEALIGGLKGGPLAAIAATLAGRATELAARSGFGAPRFMHLQADGGALLVAPTAGLLLVAVAGRDVPLGLLRLEMLRTAERLR